MNRISIEEIVKATGGVLLHKGKENYITGIKQDSRECEPGDMFVAIKGENLDGHKYIQQVMEKECTAVLISDQSMLPDDDVCENTNIIMVDDTVYALGELASWYLESLNVKKVAVTGSVGKTSARDMTYYVLNEKYNCGRNIKNYNNLIGLPLSIFLFDSNTEVVVLEMGMDRFGEIDRLAEIVKPNVAIITNIGMSHIENLGSRQGIFEAKMEIAPHITSSEDVQGTLIYVTDDEFLTRSNTAGEYNQIAIGENGKSDYIISDVDDFGIQGIQFKVEHNDNTYKVDVPVPGIHNSVNSSIAIAVGELMGVSIEEAQKGLAKVQLTGSRLKLVDGKTVCIIDDTYNASPASMKSALKVLDKSKCSGKKIAILGDMYELGEESKKEHYGVGIFARNLGIDTLIAIGEDAAEIAKGASGGEIITAYFSTKEEFSREINQFVSNEDIILVKGSRGMKMELVVEELKKI